MSKQRFTPSPWNADDTHVRTSINAVSGAHVAMVNCYGLIPLEEHEANAHLIAAAPDMYEALDNLENDDGSIPSGAWKLVQSALAKARG